MTTAERNHITSLVGVILTDVRKGRTELLEERLTHIRWLLDHPGWQVNRPVNLESLDPGGRNGAFRND